MGIGFAVLFLLMLWHGATFSWNLLWLPLLTLVLVALTLGVGLFTAALSVQFRDIRFVVPFALQIWMFASPIMYFQSLHPHSPWHWLIDINPLSGILDAYRSCDLGQPFAWQPLAWSVAFSLVFGWMALTIFRRMERSFSDII